MRQSSLDSVLRPDRVFGNLRADLLGAFDAIKAVTAYAGSTVLFREGPMARGVFLVCEGKVRLSVSSASGREMTVRVAGPGEVLGLSAVFSGSPYEVSAETLESSQVAMVTCNDLTGFLQQYPEVCLQVVRLLSYNLHAAYDLVRAVGLLRTRRRSPISH